jgi:WD40 repeat protein
VTSSPDGKRLASGSSPWDVSKRAPDATEVKLWDAQTGQELLSLQGACDGIALSPDGHRLAASAGDGTIKIWDATPLPEKP